jgi:cation:H+ antiporter
LLAVLGLAGIFADDGILVSTQALRFDLIVMIAVAAACLPIFFTGRTIARWEGALFLGYYIAYTLYLLWDAQGDPRIDMLHAGLFIFALPLTALTLILLAWRSYAAASKASAKGEGEQ